MNKSMRCAALTSPEMSPVWILLVLGFMGCTVTVRDADPGDTDAVGVQDEQVGSTQVLPLQSYLYVAHDDVRHVTCWIARSGVSCLPDSQLEVR